MIYYYVLEVKFTPASHISFIQIAQFIWSASRVSLKRIPHADQRIPNAYLH